jgi:hypothetical protein
LKDGRPFKQKNLFLSIIKKQMNFNFMADMLKNIEAAQKAEAQKILDAKLALDKEIAAAKASAPKAGIEATSLKFGFLSGSVKNFLHISSIQIITDEGVDISKACDFTSTSVYKEFGWSQLLKDSLVDGNKDTYMHTNNGEKEHLTVDFKRRYTIKQVIIQNRMDCCSERIIGANFRLFNDSKIVYDSEAITKSNTYYYIAPNDMKVYLGQPPSVVVGLDPNDPCNDPVKVEANKELKNACVCKSGLQSVEKSFIEVKKNAIDKVYYDESIRNVADWEKKINAFKSWGDLEQTLKNEKRPFKLCRKSRIQGGLFSTTPIAHSTWAGYCVEDFGPGWDAVPLSESGSYCDYYSGCSKAPWNYTTYAQCENGVAGLCKRTKNLIDQELEAAGYNKSKPSTPGAPKDVNIANTILCCSQNFSELKADTINFNNIKQDCNLNITNQINAALKPPTPPASTPPASTPPASTPPASTPPASTPPASTPPASTPPASTPPASTPPAPTPPTPPPPTPPPPTPPPPTPPPPTPPPPTPPPPTADPEPAAEQEDPTWTNIGIAVGTVVLIIIVIVLYRKYKEYTTSKQILTQPYPLPRY